MVYKKKDSGEGILKTNLWVTLFLAFNILSYLPGQKKKKRKKKRRGKEEGRMGAEGEKEEEEEVEEEKSFKWQEAFPLILI